MHVFILLMLYIIFVIVLFFLQTSLTEVDSKPSYLLHSFVSYLQTFKPYSLPIEIIK